MPDTIRTPSEEGKFTIYLRAKDMYGTLQTVPFTRNYSQYASTVPAIQITNTDLTVTKRGMMDLKVKAMGGGVNTVKQILYDVNDSGWVTLNAGTDFPSGQQEVSHTIPFNSAPHTSAVAHDIPVRVKTVNNLDVSTTQEVMAYFRADNTVPEVHIVSPIESSTINGMQRLQFSLSDDYSGVKTLYIGYFEKDAQPVLNSSTRSKY